MISQKARYAFKALIALARVPPGEGLRASEIAAREAIPRAFLDQIMLELRKHRLVINRRGKSGGYQLCSDPKNMSFSSILRAIDGPLAPLPCLSREAYRRCADCGSEADCGLRRAFAAVFAATLEKLDGLSIASAAAAEGWPDRPRGAYGETTFAAAGI